MLLDTPFDHHLPIVQRQIKPLEQLGLPLLQNVPITPPDEHLRLEGHTLEYRIVLAIAFAAQRKIELTNAIGVRRVHLVQAFVEFPIAVTMQTREVVRIRQIVARLSGGQIVAVIVRATADVHCRVFAKVIVIGRRVARTTPFRSWIRQIDALVLGMTASQIGADRIVLPECGGLTQNLLRLYTSGQYCSQQNDAPHWPGGEHFTDFV